MRDNYGLMQYFLDMIKEYAIYNPNKEITHNFVYSQLMGFNIKNEAMPFEDVSDYFEKWINNYRNNKNIDVYKIKGREHFLWFTNGKIRGNEIKLYVPLDKQHLYDGAKQIFDFISSTNIEHQSKIAKIIRNDNIVIRVNKMEDAQAIINYVTNNNYLQEGIMKVNPFLPSCNGVGLAMDNDYSFNSTVTDSICEFLNILRDKNRLDLFTVEGLNQYIQTKIPTIQDEDLKDIYKLMYKTTSKQFTLQDFVSHANNKLSDKYTSERQRILNPVYYFEQAVINTYKKYPQNIETAILEYLKGNPNYFTNDEKSRDGLKKYVNPGDVINIMRSKLKEKYVQIPNTDKELIKQYTNIILNNLSFNQPKTPDKRQTNLQEEYSVIQIAYLDTFLKYGQSQADVALNVFIKQNECKFFSGSENRDNLRKYFKGYKYEQILNVLANNLTKNDLIGNVDEKNIIDSFKQDCFSLCRNNSQSMTR